MQCQCAYDIYAPNFLFRYLISYSNQTGTEKQILQDVYSYVATLCCTKVFTVTTKV
jgi:hypothetical protein